MSQPLTPKPAPITAAEFTHKWLTDQRATIVRDNYEIRAGTSATLEVKGPRGWYKLMLPNNGLEFASVDDRDMVLRWLTGQWEIPPPPPEPEK